MLTFHILTLFPNIFKGPFDESILKKAKQKGLININIYNLRKWGIGRHKQVDDTPYGGGAGMVMRVDVVDNAISNIKNQIFKKPKTKNQKLKTILLTPQGKKFNQKIAKTLSSYSNLLLICGRYEGFDERIRKLIDMEISIGDYVLTGGEIPAMALVDAVSRLVPGVLGKKESLENESFSIKKPKNKRTKEQLLEYPQYTRPEEYLGKKVPKILLSGHHAEIQKWRQEQIVKTTKKKRPDLLVSSD